MAYFLAFRKNARDLTAAGALTHETKKQFSVTEGRGDELGDLPEGAQRDVEGARVVTHLSRVLAQLDAVDLGGQQGQEPDQDDEGDAEQEDF